MVRCTFLTCLRRSSLRPVIAYQVRRGGMLQSQRRFDADSSHGGARAWRLWHSPATACHHGLVAKRGAMIGTRRCVDTLESAPARLNSRRRGTFWTIAGACGYAPCSFRDDCVRDDRYGALAQAASAQPSHGFVHERAMPRAPHDRRRTAYLAILLAGAGSAQTFRVHDILHGSRPRSAAIAGLKRLTLRTSAMTDACFAGGIEVRHDSCLHVAAVAPLIMPVFVARNFPLAHGFDSCGDE